MTDIEIEIDGRKLSVKPNQTIIEVADEAGIYIPRFCYHKHLSVAANCRMCLVDVDKSGKALPACATPVMQGMKVSTKSKKTIDAQRAVMEFLLINHPLDCPICDQGGECELQDLSMGYGASNSEFDECKRSVAELDLGPLIATEMTRCIHCTRCVRFGTEVAGLREMGATERGEHTEIGTFIQHSLQSEISGNIIDLCPVGALTSKPYRFTARAWELQQVPSISPHDAYGSNLNVHTREGMVMRIVPRENAAVNQTWISDRDRFSYPALSHADRLLSPLVKVEDEWKEVTWEEALEFSVERLHTTKTLHGADQLVGLVHGSATTEECYLMQKIIRGMGSSHIDHRLKEVDTQDEAQFGAYPGFNFSLAELEDSDAVLIIGSNVAHELPLLAVRFRQMAAKGTSFITLNACDYEMHFPIVHKLIFSPTQWLNEIDQLSAVFHEGVKRSSDTVSDELTTLLRSKKKITIILGTQVASHPNASAIRYAADQLAKKSHATIGVITEGANGAGAWLAGAVPHRAPAMQAVNAGRNASTVLKNSHSAYILLNVEPSFDVAHPLSAVETLNNADFVLSLSTYRDPTLLDVADVILPVGPFTETSGTYVNALGDWQSFHGVVPPLGLSRPAWKVLRVLAELLGIENCSYDSSEAVINELKTLCSKELSAHWTLSSPKPIETYSDHLELCGLKDPLIYRNDAIVRRSAPLQEAQIVMTGPIEQVIKIHPTTASHLAVKEGVDIHVRQAASTIKARVQFDENIALDVVWLPGATLLSAGLDHQMGAVSLEQIVA